jgi:hypothetical protein
MRDNINAPTPDVISLSTTMDACTTGKRPDLALQLFDDARSDSGWLQRDALDLVCYGSALKACAALSASSTTSTTASTASTTAGSSSDSAGRKAQSDPTVTGTTTAADSAVSVDTEAAVTAAVDDNAVTNRTKEDSAAVKTAPTAPAVAAAPTAAAAIAVIGANEGGRRARELLLEMLAGPKHVQPNGIAYSCAIKACSQGTYRVLLTLLPPDTPCIQHAVPCCASVCE